ncbi:MAG: hypothetical protein ACREX3_02020 [Gammaproteobacteria bacterium]
MQQHWAFLLFVMPLVWASTLHASYVIKLKNGNEFVTGRYWQEGKQVFFDTYGGVFGVDKAFINSINVSNKPVEMRDANPQIRQEILKESTAKEEKTTQKTPTSSESKRDENDPIQKEFDALKAQSQSVNGMLTSELVEYAKKLAAFKKKLQVEGKTNEYLREFGEIHEMGDTVEAALKARR